MADYEKMAQEGEATIASLRAKADDLRAILAAGGPPAADETAEIASLETDNEALIKEIQILKDRLREANEKSGRRAYMSDKGVATAGEDLSKVASYPIKVMPGSSSAPQPAASPASAPAPADSKKPAAEKKAAPAQAKQEDGPVDVSRCKLVVGRINKAERHPDADALYVEEIDLGEDKPRTIISGLVKHIPIDEMQNRMVVVIANLKPAKMRGIMSEGMVMCASSPEKVEIIDPPAGAVPGDRVFCPGFESGTADEPFLNPKKKIFEAVQPDFRTTDELVATYKGAPWTVAGKGVCTCRSMTNAAIK